MKLKLRIIIPIIIALSLQACSTQQVISNTVSVAALPVKAAGAVAGTAGGMVGGAVGGAVAGNTGRSIGQMAGQSAARSAVPLN